VSATAKLQKFGGWAVSRGGIFVIVLLYLLALWVVAILYFTHTIHPRHTVGNMPVPVPWFCALGAVLISLVGIFEHPLGWNRGHAQWHWARPLVGASFAVVSVMILQAGIISIGSDPHKPGASSVLYYIVGFVVGYREETFRELIKRLVDVLLRPGLTNGDVAPTIGSVTPPSGPGGMPVTIDGSGFVKVLAVKFGDEDATAVTTESPTRIKATPPPPPTGGGTVSVSVTTKAGTATGDFTYQ